MADKKDEVQKGHPTAVISMCLEKLDQIEQGFSQHTQTISAMIQCGILTGHEVVTAGDFDLMTWSHSADGSFSVGALEKVRNLGNPFPEHKHSQRLWLLCSRGIAVLEFNGKNVDLKMGEYAVIEPMTPHSIHAKTPECTIVMVTIPADPGMCRTND
ncbi:MAG: AraC family ligand binding domain-containing protein [Desulfobacterales bacterium]|nr:AraC family ligand binding domain-containing protein [Desulfobacterales bacterium]